jgi:hypothetical protein
LVENTEIYSNKFGLRIYGGLPVLTGNTIHDNSYACYISAGLVINLSNNSFHDNAYEGIATSGTLTQVRVWDDSYNRTYHLVSGFTVQSGATLTIPSGVTVTTQNGSEFNISGRLEANDITLTMYGRHLTFTSGSSGWIKNSTMDFYRYSDWANGAGISISSDDVLIEGNHITGHSIYNSGGIVIGASPTVRNNFISGYTYNIGSPAAIVINSGSPLVENTEIYSNKFGLRIYGGLPVLTGNTIHDNSYACYISCSHW